MLPIRIFCHNVKCPLHHSSGAKGSDGMDMCRQADDRFTSCVMVGQVKGPGHVGKPRDIWDNMDLSDIHHVCVSHPYPVAQNKSAWRAQTYSTRT